MVKANILLMAEPPCITPGLERHERVPCSVQNERAVRTHHVASSSSIGTR